MTNAAEANSQSQDAVVTSDNMPAPPPELDVATVEQKLAEAEQHLVDAKEAKAHWTKALRELKKK